MTESVIEREFGAGQDAPGDVLERRGAIVTVLRTNRQQVLQFAVVPARGQARRRTTLR